MGIFDGSIRLKRYLMALLCLGLLSACGGSDSDDDDDPNTNQAPSANAGADAIVEELSLVTLDGSASTDPDGDALSYSWIQTDGTPDLTINNGSQPQANFSAPNVPTGSPQNFTFQVTVSDEDGLSSTDTVTITVQEAGPQVTLSGTLEYQFVPPNTNCQGLNFNSIEVKPIRGATVQLLDSASDQILRSTVSSDTGAYSFTATAESDVYIRIRAELKRSGTPSWDVEVRDNTTFDNIGGVTTPLAERPQYVLDGAIFNTGTVDSTRDILAETGWDGNNYSGTRAAAPFSILDVIYDAMQLVLSVDSTAEFAALDAFWSVNNSSTQGTGTSDENIDSGELGGSFYRSGIDSLFLLGMEDDDTEEFDDHVIAHEWGHYFEDNFSRSDSVGGSHALGNKLDMRVAFGEGWGSALSGMSTGSPLYCDTQDQDPGPFQSSGFGFNFENQNHGVDGWFNEISVASILFDLWDSDESAENNFDSDNDSIGFAPIYAVMTNEQQDTPAFTSIFSFMTELKARNPADSTFIDSLLSDNDITTNLDIYGSNETNDSQSGGVQDALPIYTSLTPNGSTINICTNAQFDEDFLQARTRDGNKLTERRFLEFNITLPGNYDFSMENSSPSQTPPSGYVCGDATPTEGGRYSDPDFFVYQNGAAVAFGLGCEANIEEVSFPLEQGQHVMAIVDFRHTDEDTDSNYPDRSCFDIRVTPSL